MRHFPLFFLIFFVFEIYLLITVGGEIGGLWTIFLIILSIFIGSFVIKNAPLFSIPNLMRSNNPDKPSIEGILTMPIVMISGILLMIPGFMTDMIGVLGLIPFIQRVLIRSAVYKQLKKSEFYQQADQKAQATNEKGRIIEGELLPRDSDDKKP